MTSLAPSATRPARRVIAATVLTTALLGSWYGGAPAGAHEGDGTITVDAAHPSASSVHYIVEVIFDDDQHPAPEATVTARATSPDGEDGDVVELVLDDEDEGLYQGTVPFDEPGEWTVVFSSLEPQAELEHSQTFPADDEAAEPEEGDDEGQDEGEGEGPADTVVEEPLEEPEPEVEQTNPDANLTVSEGEDDDDDDDPSLALLLLAFAVLGAVVAGVFWLVIRRKTPAGDEAAAATGPAGDEDPGAAPDDPAGPGGDEGDDASEAEGDAAADAAGDEDNA